MDGVTFDTNDIGDAVADDEEDDDADVDDADEDALGAVDDILRPHVDDSEEVVVFLMAKMLD